MSDKRIAVLMMILSSLSFAVMGVSIKMVEGVPSVEKALFRTVTVMIISFVVLKKKNGKLPKINNLKWLLIRSIFGTAGIVLNYYALSHLILSDASIIFRLSTIFTLLLSAIFLREILDKKHVIPILVAFSGIVFIVRPSFTSSLTDYFIALIGAFSASVAYMSLRVLGKTENAHMVVFFFSLFSTISLIPIASFQFVSLSYLDVVYLTAAGIFAAFGQYGITFAYKFAPAKEVSIYNYSGVIFSGLLGLLFFGVFPDSMSIIGYVIIFTASYILYRLTIN